MASLAIRPCFQRNIKLLNKSNIMEVFTITEFLWNDREGDWTDTGKILGYKVVAPNGKTLGEGETINEAQEAAFATLYPAGSAVNLPIKEKPRRRSFARR